MKMKKILQAAIAITALAVVSAQADTIEIGFSDSGWYNDLGSAGKIKNYYSGYLLSADYNNFFTFDFESLSGEEITSATLRLFTYTMDASATYVLYDVSTPASMMTARVDGDFFDIHGDLGSGTSYGSKYITTGDGNSFIDITLNASAISSINTALGGDWAIGGDFASSTGGAFSGSNVNSGNKLILETQAIPEPATALSLLIGGGLLGLIRRFFPMIG